MILYVFSTFRKGIAISYFSCFFFSITRYYTFINVESCGVSIFIEFVGTPLPTNCVLIELWNTCNTNCYVHANNIQVKISPSKPVKNWQSIGPYKFNQFHGNYKSHEKRKLIVWHVHSITNVLKIYMDLVKTARMMKMNSFIVIWLSFDHSKWLNVQKNFQC